MTAEKLTLFKDELITTRWQELASRVVLECPKIKKDREKKILASRFGINGTPKTLQAIGEKYNITRERVRQIVNGTIAKIRKCETGKELSLLLKDIERAVSENGGYATSADLVKIFTDGSSPEINSFEFITSLSPNLFEVKTSNLLKKGWRARGLKISKLKEVSEKAAKIIKESDQTLTSKEVAEQLKEPEPMVKAALSANKNLMQDEDNKWGLTKWPHINPKSIKDKSKFILKKHGKPLHYEELAEKISSLGAKKVTKQSVHNELIKNDEFILIGRGIYALREWGYEPGIVEEVIVKILSEAGEPLPREVIIAKVLERRMVKPSTIALNLQRPRFKKVGKTHYTLN